MKQLLRRVMRLGAPDITNNLVHADAWENLMLLQGTQAAMAVRQISSIPSLAEVEFKVFSQTGEDGIIEWLIAHLPGIPNVFVEFGVEDYMEANTRFLLRHRNWRGLIIDGSARKVERARQRSSYWMHYLTAVAAFIDRDNINDLIAHNGVSGEIGLLSVDIDGNDYWVWEAIKAVDPWIVVVEYNAVFGDIRALTIPYQASFARRIAHPSNLYAGAGIMALEHLAKARGYSLLGTNSTGHNAFFLRDDLVQRLDGQIGDRRPRPSLFRESRAPNGSLSYVSGIDRRDVIADMPVVDVVSGETLRLGDAGDIYSSHWLNIMRGTNHK